MEASTSVNIAHPINRVATINCLDLAAQEAKKKTAYKVIAIAALVIGGIALIAMITTTAALPISIIVPIAALIIGIVIYKRIIKDKLYIYCNTQSQLAAEREAYFRGTQTLIDENKVKNSKFKNLPAEYQTVLAMCWQSEKLVKEKQEKYDQLESQLQNLTQATNSKPFSQKNAAQIQLLIEQKFAIEATYLIPFKVHAAYLRYIISQELKDPRQLADFGTFSIPSPQADINNQLRRVDPAFFLMRTENKAVSKKQLLTWDIKTISEKLFESQPLAIA